ncbi:MAG: universal stress protein [Bacteroidia bacterium]|nr:universal stress protein [Bacteroidia bacterium]
MAISIQSVTLAAAGKSNCPLAVGILSVLAKTPGVKVKILHFGASNPDYSDVPNAEVEMVSGEASAKSIISHIGDQSPDLLILPIKSENSDAGLVQASDSCKIIDKYERTVLTVPANSAIQEIRHVFVPLDTSFETRQKTPYALFMAMRFGASLHVLGISNDTGKDAEVTVKNYTRQVANHIEEKGLSCTVDMDMGGNPTQKVIQFAGTKQGGIIIIMTEMETGIMNIFKGTYSEQMIKTSPYPVLAIHPRDLVVSEARL